MGCIVEDSQKYGPINFNYNFDEEKKTKIKKRK